MLWIDLAILTIISVSAVISLMRGFVREAFSLTGWILAFWIGATFSGALSGLLEDKISIPSLRMGLAFATLFVVTLILSSLINNLAVQVVKKTGLSGTDRMIGVLFGVGRGVVIVTILVLLGGMTPLPQDDWWKTSMFIGHFQSLAMLMADTLPVTVPQQ